MQNEFLEVPRLLLHTIRQGDTMYQLAREYGTSVESIQSLNPQTDPLNLQIGTSILIMPGASYMGAWGGGNRTNTMNTVGNEVGGSSWNHNLGAGGAGLGIGDTGIGTVGGNQVIGSGNVEFVARGLDTDSTTPLQPSIPQIIEQQFLPNNMGVQQPLSSLVNNERQNIGVPQNTQQGFGDNLQIVQNPSIPLQVQLKNNHRQIRINSTPSVAEMSGIERADSDANVGVNSPIQSTLHASKMRFVWTQHVYWTRMLLVSITEKLKDQDAVAKRLMENPIDIGHLYAETSVDNAKIINNLITEHLRTGGELITAMRDRQTDADIIRRRFYNNADKMADAFAFASDAYDRDILKKHFNRYIDLTLQQIGLRLQGNHKAEILAFGEVERASMALADYLSTGI